MSAAGDVPGGHTDRHGVPMAPKVRAHSNRPVPRVWSQDQASFGRLWHAVSVAKSGLTDRVLTLDDIGPALAGLG